MNKYKKQRAQIIAKEMVNLLSEKGYDTYYAEDVEEARKIALELIPEGASVGVGGSETLNEMNLIEELRNGPYHFFDRYQKLPFPEIEDIYRQALTADVFVSSVNAITRDGRIVNIDSSGNRVSAISFGP
ncbi:MAG: lactate utilization protein, partial [Traorella sp.]